MPSGYEQYFVVRSSAAVSKIDTLTYTLDVRGADVASTDDGGYSLITANGVEVAHVPTAFAWDAAEDSRQSHPVLQPWNSENNLGPGFDVSIAGLTDAQEAAIEEATRGLVSPVTIPVSLSLKTTGRRTTVSLDVDSAWAASPDRVLPLIIDPTIGDAYETWYDTSVNAGTGNRNSSYTSDTYLRIGWDGGANMYRSYINFQTDDVDEKDIKTASLELYNYHSWSCTDEPWQVWEVDNQPSDLTWNSQPDEMTFIAEFDETRGYDQNACPDGYISADSDAVTAMVRGWAESSDTKRGVMVKATDESDYFAWKRFYSRDYYDSTRRPKITFTYNKAPATPSDLLIKANGTPLGSPYEVSSPVVTVEAKVSDTDNAAVRASFDIYETFPYAPGAELLVASDVAGEFEPSGEFSSASIGQFLQYGSSYRIDVWSHDGRRRSAVPLVGSVTFKYLYGATSVRDIDAACDVVSQSPAPGPTPGPGPAAPHTTPPGVCPTGTV